MCLYCRSLNVVVLDLINDQATNSTPSDRGNRRRTTAEPTATISLDNKKLCYRKEDSASAVLSWFISLSALFSATYGLDIPDFSNWCLSRAHRSSIGHISAFWFWQGTSHRCHSIMPSFSVTSANIAISDISLKTRFFGLHFRRTKSWCIFNHFYVISHDRYRNRWKKAK